MSMYTIGIDYGTESARTVLADVRTGEIVATAVHRYADGVIDETLPGSTARLPSEWALQNPADWLAALEQTIPHVLALSRVAPQAVIGIGLDFTACTVLPTTGDGTPLCALAEYRRRPHAWPKLWKHHAAQPQADRINQLATARNEPWLPRYGGKLSSEWELPKTLQIIEEDAPLYAAAECIVEGGDWVVWQLTGQLARSTCMAGFKGTWHNAEGYPSPAFLADLHPALSDLYRTKLAGAITAPGEKVGGISAAWAERLGLQPGTAVAAAIIDAHSAVPGSGIGRAGTMLMAMGTSTCHMLMAEREVLVPGIAGVVADGIVPGFFGYEAGQAAVGDIFAWFVETSVPSSYEAEAERQHVSLHEFLTAKAARLRPGESGLLALDWWNGNRSPLVDADLTGLLLGYTLATTPEEIYRALIEATAFGTRMIIDTFTQHGVPVETLMAGGGLTKNPLLMQIYADVTGREVAVPATEQVAALGAAMLGAVAAATDTGGYASLTEAIAAMSPTIATVYRPNPEHTTIYNALYAEYYRLYEYFGRSEPSMMKTLRRLQHAP